MAFFPLFVDLNDKTVLVIGCNQNISYQLSTLIEFGAHVIIVSSSVPQEIQNLINSSNGKIEFVKKEIKPADVYSLEYSPLIVIAASSDLELNATVYEFYHEKHVAVEDLSDLQRCDFLFPAVIKNVDVVCGVSSSGKSAHVAHFVKELVASSIPESIGAINDRMEEVREIVKLSLPEANQAKRNEAVKAVFDRLVSDDNQTEDAEIDGMMASFGM